MARYTEAWREEAWRARIREGKRRGALARTRRNRIAPGELLEAERNGTISPKLRPYVRNVVAEVDAITCGVELDAQQLAHAREAVRLGLLVQLLVASIAQSEAIDVDKATRIGTLIAARRSTLQALGLESGARDGLDDYRAALAQRRAGAANGADPSPSDVPAQSAAEKRG